MRILCSHWLLVVVNRHFAYLYGVSVRTNSAITPVRHWPTIFYMLFWVPWVGNAVMKIKTSFSELRERALGLSVSPAGNDVSLTSLLAGLVFREIPLVGSKERSCLVYGNVKVGGVEDLVYLYLNIILIT